MQKGEVDIGKGEVEWRPLLTQYFDGVCNFAWLHCGNLAYIIAGILWHSITYLQIESTNQTHARIRCHLHRASGEYGDAAFPGDHIWFCDKYDKKEGSM